jgi:hypothetical protein
MSLVAAVADARLANGVEALKREIARLGRARTNDRADVAAVVSELRSRIEAIEEELEKLARQTTSGGLLT